MTGRDAGAGPVVLFVNTRPSPMEAEPCYAAARSLGLSVVLLADTPVPVLDGWAVERVPVDTFDPGALVDAARDVAARHDVRGVVCWGDRDVEGVAAVAAALGLPGNSPAAAAACRNKGAMRDALARAAPDLAPAFARIRDAADLTAALEVVPLPAILKPAGASASKGIFAVTSAAEARAAFIELQAFTSPAIDPIFRWYPSEMLLEQRIDGEEASVDGIVVDGRLAAAAVTDKWVQAPFFLEYLQVHPSSLPPATQQRLLDAAARAVTAAGLGTTAIHAEFRVDASDQPMLLEVNARTGGGYITTHLFPLSRGFDFLQETLAALCRLRPVAPLGEPWCAAGTQQVITSGTGVLREVRGLDRALESPGLLSFAADLPLGRPVTQPPASYTSSVIGSLIARGPDATAVRAALDTAARAVDVVVSP